MNFLNNNLANCNKQHSWEGQCKMVREKRNPQSYFLLVVKGYESRQQAEAGGKPVQVDE